MSEIKIGPGKIPTSIASGKEKVMPIQPVNPVNNNREPKPEWRKNEPDKGKFLDVTV